MGYDLRSNRAERLRPPHGELVYRLSDGKIVKLVCSDCRYSCFITARRFADHCRFKHSRRYQTLDELIEAYGEEVDMDMVGGLGESSVTSVADSQSSSGTPKTLDRAEKSAIPTDHEQREDAKHPIHSFTFNDAFPDAFPPVTPEQMMRDQGSEGTGESKGYSSTPKDAFPPVTLEKRKRDQESEGTGESKRLRGERSG